MKTVVEVVVVGAGVAGLGAWERLRSAGREVWVLEARPRLGGRLMTLHPPDWPLAVELGAEFIHGSPAGLLEPLRSAGCEVETLDAFRAARNRIWRDGELAPAGDFSGGGDEIFDRLARFDSSHDLSFGGFLREACTDVPAAARASALSYIEGFEAADPERIGIRSLQLEAEAEEELGWGQHRLRGGYDQLLRMFAVADHPEAIRLNTRVRRVEWGNGIRIEAACEGEALEVRAERAVITLPLGVLQGGEVEFDPPLGGKTAALERLVMGGARRVVLRFAQPIWEALRDSRGNSLKGLGFMFSHEAATGHFPTWWTGGTDGSGAAQMVGWAAGRYAAALRGLSAETIGARAIADLAARWRLAPRELEAQVVGMHTYDWESDPCARGAYSYVAVGGMGAQAELAAPLSQRLFFAGEATESHGHHATVYGALLSGRRAAAEILALSGAGFKPSAG